VKLFCLSDINEVKCSLKTLFEKNNYNYDYDNDYKKIFDDIIMLDSYLYDVKNKTNSIIRDVKTDFKTLLEKNNLDFDKLLREQRRKKKKKFDETSSDE